MAPALSVESPTVIVEQPNDLTHVHGRKVSPACDSDPPKGNGVEATTERALWDLFRI